MPPALDSKKEMLDNMHSGSKKPYSKPTLTIYGTVQEITKALGINGGKDSGIKPINRTSL
jgi:hypothetical protein